MVSIDMPAGLSEVLVIDDKYTSPVHIAADLLSRVAFSNIRLLLLITSIIYVK